MNFKHFKDAVARNFEVMSRHELFRVDADKNEIWDTYINAFPVGSNPIFAARTEHDCNCCKQFARTIGGVVAFINGKKVTIWDVEVPQEPNYQIVADKMAEYVRSRPVVDHFLHNQTRVGTDKSRGILADGSNVQLSHFSVDLPRQFVCQGDEIPTALSKLRSNHDVFLRGLKEVKMDAIDSALDLISQNAIYRGEEHKFAIESFRKAKVAFDKLKTDAEKDAFVWLSNKTVPGSVSKFKNTAIGTLIFDLSEGYDLEDAVKSFESKVAPTNYKRTTALVSKAMIEKAGKTIEDLGLSSALQRRHAVVSDVSVNDVIFVDRKARSMMKGDVFGELAESVGAKADAKKLDRVDEITIDKFLKDVLPRAESIEVLFEDRHAPNLLSIVAPVHADSGKLFKWDNGFSWAYNGDVTDSIKERVKRAGGSIVGDLCCRLAWNNHDDLDFHMTEPNKYEIYFGNKGRKSTNGGMLDVDMNAGGGTTRTPVENIFYQTKRTMQTGTYTLYVHGYSIRETKDVGFQVEIDAGGETRVFNHPEPVRRDQRIEIAKIRYSANGNFEIDSTLQSRKMSKTIWGLQTESFVKVDLVTLSPNHWGDVPVGNKHYIFVLNGCKNEGTPRGFFNEFLRQDLDEHRKVFEIVGSKMKVEDSAEQLSGLGFSSTKPDTLLCRVKGSVNRVVKIVF